MKMIIKSKTQQNKEHLLKQHVTNFFLGRGLGYCTVSVVTAEEAAIATANVALEATATVARYQ